MHLIRQSTSLTLTVIILLAQLPISSAAQFNDVQTTPYLTAFTYLSERNVVQGYNDGSGRPYAQINRVEVVKVLTELQSSYQERLQWYQQNVPPIALFSDVNQTQWYVPYLETAFESKMVTGYPDGTFRPANAISVEEALAMLVRSFGINQVTNYTQSQYIQNAPDQWYTSVINTAITRNIISSRERLYIGAPITRGQFFDAVYRLHSSIQAGETSFNSTGTSQTASIPPRSGQTPVQTPVATPPSSNVPPSTISSPTPVNNRINAEDAQYLSSKPFAISIPSVGIYDLSIVRPVDYSSDGLLEPLQSGVGHLFSFPGGGGKIMVYGHSSSYPWDTSEFTKIFRKINEAKSGDKVYVTYNNQLYIYQVTFEETIPAADTSRFKDDGSGETLILYTCWPPDSVEQRYLVHAVPVY
jgi:LPXTG-site transpeptidase (sortase) family protein